MRCLLKYVLTLIEVCYLLSLTSLSYAYGHVGEKCPFVILFRMCMASNAYCDSNNICRCKTDYPVLVDAHTCKKPRRVGERCSVNAECTFWDGNSYCTQLSYHSVCECHEGFRHDSVNDKCAKVEKTRSSNPNLVLPMAVGLSLALICLICCCLATLHICRKRRRRHHCRRSTSRTSNRAEHRSEEVRWAHSTPSAPEDLGTLPSYDVAVTLQPIKDQDINDEYPPSYDEVMKDNH